jgi:hypothetical protein
MRTWGRIFVAYAAFGAVAGTVYWLRTNEPAGSVLLWAMAAMPAIVVAFAAARGAFRARLPEDDPEAGPAAGEEELGSFPTASVWPLIAVVGALVGLAAIVYGWILLPISVALLGWALVGLARESRG